MLKIANHSLYYKKQARELVEDINGFNCNSSITLRIEDLAISLASSISQQAICYQHSFLDSKLISRANQKNQALLRACNNKKKTINTILDLTAGWGKDSFMLASQGHQVQMVEQNVLLAACLKYLISIAVKEDNHSACQRLEIVQENSLSLLRRGDAPIADCIYLDPMFPSHKSSAKPGKDLQMLQLLTLNQHIEDSFLLALQLAGHRVVVKRPLHAPNITEQKADIVYKEKTVRFDVYLT